MLEKILNFTIIILVPFIMVGIINKTKAFWAGRKGASIFQPLYDFIRLIKKDFVISNTTSLVFKITPIIAITTAISAAMFVPLAFGHAIINIPAGFIIFAYTLGLGKFFALISAMDTGSSFEGMGASREACFTTIVEPAFFTIIASVMALTGNYTFDCLHKIIENAQGYGALLTVIAVVALFLMILIEGSRVPVDDPTTHLELTMIHEVMILDNCSQELAIISYSAWAKMFLISSLIATLILPLNLSFWVSLGAFLGIMIAISIIIGTVESAIARLRMSHVFEFVFIMSSLALVVASLVALKLYGV